MPVFNRTYLSRLFKSKINLSYIDYLTKVRMENAMKLLAKTKLPVKAIVSRIGYVDDSSFRRKFKALYGISVAEYRKHQHDVDMEYKIE